MAQPLAEKKQIHFVLELDPQLTAILVDKLRFNRVFLNLLSNAMKFTPAGGTVSLKLEQTKQQAGKLFLTGTVAWQNESLGKGACTFAAGHLVCVDENKLLVDIEKLIRRPLPSSQVSGFEVDPRIQAEPIPNGRNTPRGGGGGGRSGGGQPRSGGGQGSHHGGPGAPRAPSATPRPAGQGQSRAPKKPTSRHH